MNVKKIIIKYLKKNGYDGLCHGEIECGCGMEDICLMECAFEDCEPAYKRLIDGEELYTTDKNYGTEIEEYK